jgi:hypothetical protein
MKYQDYTFNFKEDSIAMPAFSESYARILAQEEAAKRGWDSTIIHKEGNKMNKRQYISQLHLLETLPVPGTILYPPNSTTGHKLLYYEINDEKIEAVVESDIRGLYICWTLKQVGQCTWDKMKEGE